MNKNNFKRDEGFILSQARPLTTDRVMKVKAGPSRVGTLLRHLPSSPGIPRSGKISDVVSSLVVETEMVFETLVYSPFNHVTRSTARESVIECYYQNETVIWRLQRGIVKKSGIVGFCELWMGDLSSKFREKLPPSSWPSWVSSSIHNTEKEGGTFLPYIGRK